MKKVFYISVLLRNSFQRIYKFLSRTLVIICMLSLMLSMLVYNFFALNDNSINRIVLIIDPEKNAIFENIDLKVYHDDAFKEDGDLLLITGKVQKIANAKNDKLYLFIPKELELVESSLPVLNKYSDSYNKIGKL